MDIETIDQHNICGFPRRSAYSHREMIAYANREYGPNLPPLPLPPWLMLHRITHIEEGSEEHGKGGKAIAEYDVDPHEDYFVKHFKGSPIMPGALGIDALQQLAGFMLGWLGARGVGMALSIDGVRYRGAVGPDAGVLRIEIIVTQARLSAKMSTIKASGGVYIGPKLVYAAESIAVGIVPQAPK